MKRTIRKVTVVGAVALALAAAGCGTKVAGSGSPAPAPSATQTVPAPAPAPEIIPAPETSEPAPTPEPTPEPTEAEQVISWWTETEDDMSIFQGHIDQFIQLTSDPEAVLADTSEIEALIETLISDVDTLKSHGPVPSPEINKPWQKALDSWADGYGLWLEGFQTMDPDTLSAGTSKVEEGNEYLDQSTQAIQDLPV
jgi:hypothetical protein